MKRTRSRRRLCRLMPVVFGVLYLLALTVFVVGTFGFFGQVRDPLSGVSLIPLGMPWNWMIDLLPEPLWPWLAAAAPSINLGILWMLCRLGLRSSADERTSF